MTQVGFRLRCLGTSLGQPLGFTSAACLFISPLGISRTFQNCPSYLDPAFIEIANRLDASFVNIGWSWKDASLNPKVELEETKPQSLADFGSR